MDTGRSEGIKVENSLETITKTRRETVNST